ncbi:metal ABC transporter permease [Lysinibacillus pakistanensis]|uniref:Manganese transport system membrane protein MntC n=1 Tax=Lysinibacillus pakistanensis TaxID=759811 RepID=A0AAX3WPA3_9BACI|nr:metal ABC transporter permease [Lysinibacillus pakistanensis]MDM5233998.1 metal ABC transporter permease [Lysinibacillus pakistanensis]WHY44603.1 metal ABC transporter permease [Lysinibacillus pakistanensis]WHY49611.1 metal ABC transporter permease [Lysinibacillus pakistanensis]
MLSGNLLWVLSGTMLLGIAAGITGTFSFLQKQSLVGDAAAHAALPGIALAFLLTGQKELPILMLGAGITSALSVYCIQWIVSFSKLKADAAIGLVLTVFFGIGVVFLTVVNRSPLGNQSGLNNFIFGKAATMTKADLMWLFISATIIILVSLLLYKEWKLLIFDPVYAKGIGLPIEALKATLTVLIVMTIVTGIQAVGVILMSALLIIPAASAKLWTKKLSSMLMLSAIIGGVSGITGTFISAMRTGLSTGPIIVLVAAAIFFLSYFISPSGQISKYRRKMQFRKQGELG